MEARLKVMAGTHAGKNIPLRGPKFLIGRSDDCHLRAGSDLVSRHHCAIIKGDTYVGVRDFGSRNGTYVNGERIGEEVELHSGDYIRVGPLEFEVVIRRSEEEWAALRKKGSSGSTVSAEPSSSAERPPGGTTQIAPPAKKGEGEKKPPEESDTKAVSMSESDTVQSGPPAAGPGEQTTDRAKQTGKPEPEEKESPEGKTKEQGEEEQAPPKKGATGQFRVEVPKAKDSREAAANVLKRLFRRR